MGTAGEVEARGLLDEAPLEPGKSGLGEAETSAWSARVTAPSVEAKTSDVGTGTTASANRDSWLGALAGRALSRDVMDAQCKGFCALFGCGTNRMCMASQVKNLSVNKTALRRGSTGHRHRNGPRRGVHHHHKRVSTPACGLWGPGPKGCNDKARLPRCNPCPGIDPGLRLAPCIHRFVVTTQGCLINGKVLRQVGVGQGAATLRGRMRNDTFELTVDQDKNLFAGLGGGGFV